MARRRPDQDWQDDAACRGIGGDLWYARHPSTEAVLARQICLTQCEVRAQCLQHALLHNEHWGIWGGLTERERRRLQRPRGVPSRA